MPNRVSRLALGLTITAFLAPLAAQSPPASQSRPVPDMLGRIFSGEFSPHFPRAPHWFGGGDTYIAIEPATGGQGVDVVRYDTATGERREVLITCGAAHATRREHAALDCRFVLVRGSQARACVHEHAPCLADGLARRLLAPRSRHRQAQKARRRSAGSKPDVCNLQPGRDEGRLRVEERHLRRGRRDGCHHADYSRWIRPGHQRRIRLGQRGGARSPRLLSLEPRWAPDRVLAVRSSRRRQFFASGTYLGEEKEIVTRIPYPKTGPYPVTMSVPYPLAGDDELGGARRRGRQRRWRGEVAADPRRSARALHRTDAMG